ncbi:hypothetical protein [uncultured Ferrimonas sp.]|uniref:hypothetical protein n=1 Tax=uncultured Ferrimonas sp. TaxID=432640 RepID=UPI002639A65F|nr:hypothetical protein [uncultured Ferrimonas sp.]
MDKKASNLGGFFDPSPWRLRHFFGAATWGALKNSAGLTRDFVSKVLIVIGYFNFSEIY